MRANEVLERCQAQGIRVEVAGDKLRLSPPSQVSLDLLELVRQHKAEVLAYLARPAVVDAPPVWHAEEIKRRVERDGLCLFWSDLFGEAVAFIADEVFREQVPAGVVCYTVKELDLLFGNRAAKPSDSALKLIHEAKKHDGRVIEHGVEGEGIGDG